MNKKTTLKPSKEVRIERKIETNDLSGKKNKIFIYPIRTDTVYILLRPTKKSPKKIHFGIDKVEDYLLSIGFKRNEGRDCIRYTNEYGLTIFYGKVNQYDKERSLKFQGTGQYLIYAQAELVLRRIVNKVHTILSKRKVLCDKKITRIDPSVLIMAESIGHVIPNLPLGHNMKQANYFYEGTSEISGVSFKNSKIQLKCYDKIYDLLSSDHSADYLNFFIPYIREAKKRKLKLFRLELKISNREMIFENYEINYLSRNWNEKKNEECLLELFARFFKRHKFRKPKDNQKSITDRRNISRWDIDPITKEIFTGNSKVIIKKSKRKKKFTHSLNAPRSIRGLDDCIKKFAKELSRINPYFSRDDLERIQKDMLVQYGIEKYNVEISVLDRIERQAAFRLSVARGKAEKKLINEEKEKLIKDLSARKSNNRGLFGDIERQARELLLKECQNDSETS